LLIPALGANTRGVLAFQGNASKRIERQVVRFFARNLLLSHLLSMAKAKKSGQKQALWHPQIAGCRTLRPFRVRV
jgi:hypothetical protein